MKFLEFTISACAVILLTASIAYGTEDSRETLPVEAGEGEALRREIQDLRLLLQELEARLTRLERSQAGRAEVAHRGERPTPAPPERIPTVPSPQRLNIFNPQITLFGNALARADNRKAFTENGDPVDDRFNLREVELDARAAIDPYADGVVILSFESEVPNEFEAGVEEGYLVLKRLPFSNSAPAGLKLKLGRTRTEFGRMNLLHTHDLPQATRPLSLTTFLGEEGFIQNGVSGTFFLPSFDPGSTLEWTLQIMDGGDLPVAEANRGADLAYLSHLKWFRNFRATHDLDIGISQYFGRNDPSGHRSTLLHGFDFTYKWKPLKQGEWRSLLLGGELFYASREREFLHNATPFGFFTFAQYQLNWHWYGGIRYDFTNRLEDDGRNTEAWTLYASYYTSEFLRFRFGFETRQSDLPEEDGRNTGRLEVNFVFGSHPVEPYWVNR